MTLVFALFFNSFLGLPQAMLDSSSDCVDGLTDGEEAEEDSDEDEDGDGESGAQSSDYLARLQREARQLMGLEDDYSSDSDFTDDEDMETPIAAVDPFATFVETMALLEKGAPQRMQSLMAGADANAQSAIRGMIEFARQRKAAPQQGKDLPNGGGHAAQTG